ncbi:MAG: hypothetical protein NTZ56_21285 [Acidobacteria bacterium]|nr:hypothetical protein [Acidobacteriota bacterium]
MPMVTFVAQKRWILAGLALLAAACQSLRGPAPPPPPGGPSAAEAPRRPVYRHSVLAGGVQSAAEVKQRLAQDAPAAAHYRQVKPDRLKPVQLTQDRRAYVSYRVGDKIYWTRTPQLIKTGELVLTDGQHTVRARCGNRVEDEPQDEVQSADESPADEEFDQIAELDGHWPLVGAPSGRAGRQLKDLVEPLFSWNQGAPVVPASGGGSSQSSSTTTANSPGNHWGGFPSASLGGNNGITLPWEPAAAADGRSPYPQPGTGIPGTGIPAPAPILPPATAPEPEPDIPVSDSPTPNSPGPDNPNPSPSPGPTPSAPASPEPPPYGPPVKPPPTSPPPSPWPTSPIPSPPWPDPPTTPPSPRVPPVEPKERDTPQRPQSPPWSPGPPESPDQPFAPEKPADIPEPATGVLCALGAALLLIGHRRRRS